MMIITIPDILTPDEVGRFRDLLDGAEWQDGRGTAGHVAARAKHNQQIDQDDPRAAQLSNALLERLGSHGLFISAALPLRILPPRFNRYTGNGSYGDHIDNAIFSVPGSPLRVRGDLSSTLFLSDPDSYDGGELVFQHGVGAQRIKLPAGHMVLYPADTIHHVVPVTRGTRLAAFFWTQSLIRETHRRAMLFELDETIQSMVSSAPDNPAIVRLTGLYHNLLRDWSNT
jgi:PKHD-type hydroxylase